MGVKQVLYYLKLSKLGEILDKLISTEL